jgi:hypothetical protein
MLTSDECRVLSEQCFGAAEGALPKTRDFLLHMANLWHQLAQEKEARNPQRSAK